MSEKNDYKAVDLLVIITRLHANRDAHEDEFKHDWTPPDGKPENAGFLPDACGGAAFWMLSDNHKAGLLVIHGYNGLLGKTDGAFQTKILEFIRQAGLDQRRFSRLFLVAHGQIPETEAELGSEKKEKPLLIDVLEAAFASVLRNNYTTHGNEAVALALPKTLRDAGIGDTLRIMVADRLKLEPAVDVAVHSMQHILLEMRLWCDLWFSKKEKKDKKTNSGENAGLGELTAQMREWSANVSDCIDRLKDGEHWQNRAARNVLSKETSLKDFLCGEAETSWLGTFFEKGGLTQISDRTNLDVFLRDCSARLEKLIVAAAEKDMRGAAS